MGTAFAFCEESGIAPEIKRRVLEAARAGTLDIFTDPKASPTGFPFKVARLGGSMADPGVLAGRERVCDLGFLRALAECEGRVLARCPGEPLEDFCAKGGDAAEAEGRVCVCNGLMATIGLGQVRRGGAEPFLVTAGNDAAELGQWLEPGKESYTAAEVVRALTTRI